MCRLAFCHHYQRQLLYILPANKTVKVSTGVSVSAELAKSELFYVF